MEAQPYETPLEQTEFGSERRARGLAKLAVDLAFEEQWKLYDSGKQSVQELADKTRAARARIFAGFGFQEAME